MAIVLQIANGSFEQGPISLDQPVGTLPIVDDARWSAALTSHSVWALLAWMVMLVAFQAAAWPLVRRLFPRFPDQGWAFARLTTLLLSALVVWYAASFELLAFRAIWCGIAVALLAAIAWGLDRASFIGKVHREPWYRHRAIVATEVVFWGAFLLFLLFRLINPDSYHPAWGGEKPMEFAHINAILRSAHFPPYDPWYADGLLNYYYYGMYLVAFMMKLTGIPSEIAFNLAQPTIIAFLATGAFSVAMAIARAASRRQTVVLVGGLLGVVLVSVAGNLVVAARAFGAIVDTAPPLSDFRYWYWTPREIVSFTINEFPWFTATYADLHAHVVALGITMMVIAIGFSLVQSSRELVLACGRPRRHPEAVIQVGGLLLLAGLSLGTLYATNAWDLPTYAALMAVSVLIATRAIRSFPIRIAISAALAIALGWLAWLVALPFLQGYVALYGEVEANRTVTEPVQAMSHFGVFFVIIAFGLSLLIARDWDIPAPSWLAPAVGLGLLTLLLVRWYGVDQSPLWIARADTLLVAAVAFWFVFALLRPNRRRLDFRPPPPVETTAVLVYGAAVIVSLATDRIACALFLTLAGPAVLLCLGRRSIAERYIALLIAGAMLVGAAMELVFLVDGLEGTDYYRMNTVFKFYNQVWIMAAIASAGLIAIMVRTVEAADSLGDGWSIRREADESAAVVVTESLVGPVLPTTSMDTDHDSAPEPAGFAWGQVGLIASALVIAAALAYPLLASSARLHQQYPQDGVSITLNAIDWMTYGEQADYSGAGVVFTYDGDREIIDWFNEHVPGTPVIAEASLDQYACATSRIANHTGLPTVIGWPWHQQQQRGTQDIAQRQADVRTLYSSTDVLEKQAILSRYRVEYIVVGDLERAYPSSQCQATDNTAGISALESMVDSGNLEVAFRSGDAVVFQVVSAG